MRSRIDSIRYAASLVLAGCAPSNPTTPVDKVRTVPPPDPSELVVVEREPPHPVPQPVPDPVPQPLPHVTVAPDKPQDVCQAYRDRIDGTPDDPRQLTGQVASRRQSGYGQREGVRGWAAGEGKVMCTIIWETKRVQATVTVHPTCCPSPGGRQYPCPQPHEQPTQGTEVLQEEVTIEHGTPTRTVERVTYVVEPGRHACGRRPQGFALEPPRSSSAGDVLATMAALEAASVSAFHRLARELEAHAAPAELIARARSAMGDEVRHARSLRRLARARGGKPVAWRRASLPVRSRLELGVENATEGCVSEAFGAATALVQAARATDPEVREAFAKIADDELEHAALAWDVHAWLVATGSDDERRKLAEALREAVDHIEHADPGPVTRAALGLPDRATSQVLLGQMVEQLGLAA